MLAERGTPPTCPILLPVWRQPRPAATRMLRGDSPEAKGFSVRVCFLASGASHQASDSKLASVLPNAVNFSGAGHIPPVTHPERFVQLVSAFIGDNSAPRSVGTGFIYRAAQSIKPTGVRLLWYKDIARGLSYISVPALAVSFRAKA
jgi:hypothetical protein